jgi:ATP-dependent helicase/nuclease subunit A
MTAWRHEMILASAGSGKTYALTNRFVRLLAHGAPPERIVALTFTRKAAGEFFDEILKKLARAATSTEAARKLAEEIAAPALGATDFLRLLRSVVESMPRLNLGTLDGFFARIVQAFPLELGLDGEFEIMDAAAARRERRRVLRRMFSAASEPDAAQREFIEAFKRATFGVEEKRLARVLDGFLDDHGETFLAAPDATQWGEAARIWKEGSAWLAAAGGRSAATQELKTALAGMEFNEKQRVRWEDFFVALAEWSPGATLPKPLEYILKNAFEAWPELEEIVIERKKVALTPAVRPALRAVLEGVAGAELGRRLEMTRGIFAVLRGYEQSYDGAVRRAGRLTFADVLRLLLPSGGAPKLMRGGREGGDDEDARLLIDWRLDAKFDHWLLDEFQDTSFEQWSVLRNLIDEAVQDPEGRRSLFYVGDVKQAIFAWRGGDPRLFREIFEHYNEAMPDAIAEGRLDTSWRSGPAVIAMVNCVFGAAEVLQGMLPVPAAEAWVKEWRDHVSAQPALGGFAELRHAADEAGRFAETLQILREVEPARRGLEVAVLVLKNSTATALADYLRREGGLAAVAESDLCVATDNPLTSALLALLRAAAYPGDTLAREHVRMTPLEALLTGERLLSRDALTAELLAEVHEAGFAGTLERWLRRLAPVVAGDEFSAERGRLLIAAAEKFDESGSRDVAEFLEFAERHTVREADAAGVVRVMTVHKAKGLGFDLVILPDLEGKKLATRRDGLAVQRAADRSVEWVLELPAKVFAERDSVLAAHVATAESEAAYENLCLLYVAMTRAKRALYLIVEPPAAKSTSQNFTRLLRETLGESWADGDARWFEKIIPVEGGEAGNAIVSNDEDEGAGASWPLRAARRPARTPSGLKKSALSGSLVFALGRNGAADFGTAVHARFSELEWIGAGGIGAFAERWRDAGVANDAVEEVLACLRAPTLVARWTPPVRQAEVWRERAFEMVLDGAWVTGIFDRVVVEFDQAGRAVQASVIDFKTDRVTDTADVAAGVARHAGQLNLYRRVVAVLTGLACSQVSCELIFTRLQRVETVVMSGG